MSDVSQHNTNADLLGNMGYIGITKCADALQGSVWKAVQQHTHKNVVVKVANRELHSLSITTKRDGSHIKVSENILMERQLLKSLAKDKKCPRSIIKYIDFLKSNINYYLVMEDGGHNLFDFIVNVHKHINNGYLNINEWHKMAKIIFEQMIECIEYLHSKNICHFDISLENWLINDIQIEFGVSEKGKFTFCYDMSVQIKLIDFGLAALFEEESDCGSDKYCGKEKYHSPEITVKKNTFNAKANDVWCLGVCLYMMIIGGSPWYISSEFDNDFMQTMEANGDISDVIRRYNRYEYADKDLIDLFQCFFKYEDERWDLSKIRQNMKWLQK